MFNYIVIANKKFKDFDYLQEKLDVYLVGRKGVSRLWVLGENEKDKTQKNIHNILKKYCNWNGIELHNLTEENLAESELDDILAFESELDSFLHRTYKNLWKYERYKPVKFIKK